MKTIIILVAIAIPLIDAALLRPGRRSLGSLRLLKVERLVYFLFLLALGAEAISSFVPMLTSGRMRGWMHGAHMLAAGAYAVSLTALALLWAEQSSFERGQVRRRFYTGEKASFWLMVLFGLLTLVSGLLGMLSWFGSDAQRTLFEIHRYGALLLVICVIYNGYRVLLGRPGPKSAAVSTSVSSSVH